MEDKDRKFIIEAFNSLQGNGDLLKLLNYVKPLVIGSKAVPFTISQLNYNAYVSINKEKRYKQFSIPKKNGGERIILAPENGLKAIQVCLNSIFQIVHPVHSAAKGFVKGSSIVQNAQEHIGQLYVYNIDLKDFFTSIESGRLFKRLTSPPFNMKSPVASYIADLCCHPIEVERKDECGEYVKVIRNVLPQGAPTSPTLTNIICEKMDNRLSSLAKKYGLRYSRYADDITFSGMYNAFKGDGEFIASLQKIILQEGFVINEKKTRLQKNGERQEVTGLIVSHGKVNVTRKYVSDLRGMIHYAERSGVDALEREYNSRLLKLGRKKPEKPVPIKRVLIGKLLFLSMVKGLTDSTYISLRRRYDKLFPQTAVPSEKNDKISPALHGGGVDDSGDISDTVLQNELQSLMQKCNVSSDRIVHLLGQLPNSKIGAGNKNIEPIKEEKHDPKIVVGLLKKFSERGTALKNTTHDWEFTDNNELEWNYANLVEKYKQELEELHFKIIKDQYSKSTARLIEKFLLDDGEEQDGGKQFQWGKDHISVGFTFPKGVMEEWLKNHPGKDPFQLPLALYDEKYRQFKINGKTPRYFRDVADSFKKCIAFRDNDLYYLIKKISRSSDYSVDKVKLESLRAHTFYTNTGEVEKALKIIFENIGNRSAEHQNVEVSMSSPDDNTCLLEILHVDSIYDTRINNDKLTLRNSTGQFHDIKKHLQSLCEWSVEGRFSSDDGGPRWYRIDYLNSEKSTDFYSGPFIQELPNYYEQDIEIKNGNVGFKHLLKFYL